MRCIIAGVDTGIDAHRVKETRSIPQILNELKSAGQASEG
jgi:hypothetical protein